jgi:hypothetical protein
MNPVGRKPRLPGWLSYPIGFELVSEALGAVRQFTELELRFCTYPRGFRQTVEAGLPHVVFSADFARRDKSPSIGNSYGARYLDGHWTVCVYPVRRQLKAQARGALLAHGLPAIEKWLQTERAPSWYWGQKQCKIMFDPIEGAVRVEERVWAL